MTEEIKEVEKVEEVDLLKENKLEMRNLKTKDLPKIMRIVRKADAKSFAEIALKMVNKEVDKEIMDKLKAIRTEAHEAMQGKTEEEVEIIEEEMNNKLNSILSEVENEEFTKIITVGLDTIVENFDKVYEELNDFVAGLYNLTVKKVEDLDLDVLFACIYNLRNQDKLINFFKTALKKTQ